jgi:hypothetical protein
MIIVKTLIKTYIKGYIFHILLCLEITQAQ